MRKILWLSLILLLTVLSATLTTPKAEAVTCQWYCGPCGAICPCEFCGPPRILCQCE